jgi:hypothetical protein
MNQIDNQEVYKKYTFPFDTCETPNKTGIAQPWSASVVFISCCIIFYFLLQCKTTHAFILLSTFLLFQLSHCFSHSIFLSGYTQLRLVHSLVYVMNAAFLYAFYKYTGVFPSSQFIIVLLALIIMDIYGFMYLPFIYYLITQSAIFISILYYYYSYLNQDAKTNIIYIFALVLVIMGLVINEKTNGKRLMNEYPGFPFHILIEIVGAVLFYIIAKTFYII